MRSAISGALDALREAIAHPESLVSLPGATRPELDDAPLLPASPLVPPPLPVPPLVPPLAEASLPASVPLLDPASIGAPASAPVTVIMRVVTVTASPPVPPPLAAMPATYIVIGPFAFGAMNESLYVAVEPFGGGTTAAISVGSCAASGVSVFEPLIVFTPSLNAAFIDVRVRLPATTIVTCDAEPAWTVCGTVIVSAGGFAPDAWQFVVHVSEMPLYGLPE
ncbi:MAG: hypothetical protein JWP87_591 [Labilithrix sp.]|nr:hypothetical protein [Labilithrix sp.]